MANQNPSTPVKVPSSAANHTAATLDPDLRSQINSILIKEGHVTKIQEHLLHALNSHQANWPTMIQTHALTLLRSGEISSFPALLRRVIEDVRHDTALAPSSNGATNKAVNGVSADENGATVNGKKTEGTNGATTSGPRPNLAIPQAVVDEALKSTRECLESMCEIDESGSV